MPMKLRGTSGLMTLSLEGDRMDEDICGLCGLLGADKIPHPIYWPDEMRPNTLYVHAECEREECERASALCQGKERDDFLEKCRNG